MHHYKNITIKLIAFSPTLLKTQREELTFTHMGKIKKKKNYNKQLPSKIVKNRKIAKGQYRISFFSVSSGKGEVPVRCYRLSLYKSKSSLKFSFRYRNKPE